MRRGMLLDLDGTLYSYPAPEGVARRSLCERVAARLDLDPATIGAAYLEARDRVRERLGARGSAHSRLLYLHELLAMLGRFDAVSEVPLWNREYWDVFLCSARLSTDVVTLLSAARARGWRTAIVTDLTLDVQLRKCAEFGLLGRIDALVASEEVAVEKPDPAVFLLGAARIGVNIMDCIVVGDDDARDGMGARRLGIPFLHAGEGGCDLATVIKHILGDP